MSEKIRLVKNTGIIMGMELGVKSLEVVVAIVLARYLSPQGFGLLAFAIAFASLFEILASLGMSTLITRDVAGDPKALGRYLSHGLAVQILLSVAALATLGWAGSLLKFPAQKWTVVFVAGLLMIVENCLDFSSSFFKSFQQMGTVAVLTLALRMGWMVAALGVVWFKGDLVQILLARVFISLGVVAGSLWLVHSRLHRIVWQFDLKEALKMLRASFPFALFGAFVMIYIKIDLVMLSLMKGDQMTGWYAAAQKFRQGFVFIPASVRDATLPAMSKFSTESPARLRETIRRSCKYLWMISLPASALISIFADTLIRWIYGPAYLSAIPALRIVIWTMVFSFINNVFTVALYALKREKEASWTLAFGMVFNILTNLLAIPRWGHVGAATTTVLSEMVVFAMQIYWLRKVLPSTGLLSPVLKPFAAVSTMVFFLIAAQPLAIAFRIFGAVVLYAAVLFFLGDLGREEWKLVRGAFFSKGEAYGK